MNEESTAKTGKHDPEEMLEDALAEPLLTGESRIPEAQTAAAAFLVLAVGVAAHINAWLPLRVEAAALLLHLASALAVYMLARHLLRARTEVPAMACGMLFAAHPLAVAATQSGELRVLMGTLLGLLALSLALAASDADRSTLDLRRTAVALLLYTAAALSYPPLIIIALAFPFFHHARTPVPVHTGMRLVYACHALLFAGLVVALPYLTETGGTWREGWALFTKSLALLLGLSPMSVWHPVPAAGDGWLTLIPLLLAVLVTVLAMRARSVFGPALAYMLLLAGAAAYYLPLDAVPLEPALYPMLAGLALALGALASALGRLPGLGAPAAGVVAVLVIATAGLSTYARNALFIEPLAPLRAAVDQYPDEAEPRLMLAHALYEQAQADMGADAFARGQAPAVLRAGDARSHLQAALRYTGEVVDTFGLSADAMFLQGKILTGLGRAEEAAEDLFIALRMAPWRPEIARALGTAYATMDDPASARKAADYYESAAHRTPDDDSARVMLVHHLERSGLLGRLAYLDDDLLPDAQWETVQDLHRRDQQIRQRFQAGPFNPDALTAYAEERIERGQPQLAYYALHEVLRREPENAEAWGKLADLAVEAGNHAVFAAEFADTPIADAGEWESRAVRYASAGQWEAAASFLRNSIPDGAEDGAYWLRLADLAIATQQTGRAQQALDAAREAGAGTGAITARQQRLDGQAQ